MRGPRKPAWNCGTAAAGHGPPPTAAPGGGAGDELGTLFLGADLRLRWFTPGAAAVFQLMPEDTGRGLGELAPRLGGRHLPEVAAAVLKGREAVEARVDLPDGREGVGRLFRAAGPRGRPDGVVLTFRPAPDAGDAGAHDGPLAADFRAVVLGAPVPVVVHTLDGEILALSRAVTRLTGYTRRDLPDGRAWLRLVLRLPEAAVEQMLAPPAGFFASGPTPPPVETAVWTREGEQRVWLFQASPLQQLPDGRLYVAATATDVTERRRAEEACRKSEERLHLALRGAQAGSWEWDVATGTLKWSAETYALYGLDVPDGPPGVPNELAWRTHVPPEDVARVEQALRDALARPAAGYRQEFRVRHPARGERWLAALGRVECDPDGTPRRLAGIAVDVTERKRAEQALHYSERTARRHLAELEATYATAPVGLCLLDPECRWVRINQTLADINGLPAAEHLGRRVRDLLPRIAGQVEPLVGQVLRSGRPVLDVEVVGETPAFPGQTRVWKESLYPLRDADGTPLGVNVVCEDITERKKADQALREGEERLRLALAGGEMGTWELDRDTGLVRFDAQQRRLFGLDPDRAVLTQEEVFERIHPDDRRAAHDSIEQLRGRGGLRVEFRVLLPGGRVRWLAGRGGPMAPEPGRPNRVLGVNYDITPLKEAEAALRASEEGARRQLALLETIYAATPVGMAFLDTDLRHVRVNRYLAEINGRPAAEHLGRTPEELLGRPGRLVTPILRQVLDTRQPIIDREVHAPAPGGGHAGRAGRRTAEARDWLINVLPVEAPDGGLFGLAVTVLDITNRKRLERSLRQLNERLEHLVTERTASLRASEEQVRTILDTAAEGIVTIDAAGQVLSFNQAAERMFGYTAKEMIGRNVKRLMPPPHRARHDGYLAAYRATGARKMVGSRREMIGRRKDGTLFPIEIAVSEVSPRGPFTGIIIDISRRRELEREVVEVAAAEQHRIGQELHDGVGQELTGLNLMLAGLAGRLEAAGRAEEAKLAARVAALLRQTHQEVRALSRGIVPVEVDPEGLRTALEELVARTREQSGLSCTFAASGRVAVNDTVTATHLYRIAQEATANALRHARARRLDLALRAGPHDLTLTVRDDGVGPPPGLDESRGLGIRLMRYRAGVQGGTLAVEAAEGGGTLVTCIIPRKYSE